MDWTDGLEFGLTNTPFFAFLSKLLALCNASLTLFCVTAEMVALLGYLGRLLASKTGM